MIFTDAQIKSISAEYIGIPLDIAKAKNSLAAANTVKADYLQKDQNNTVFMNNALNIITQYHLELGNLVGQLRSNYSVSNIEPAARMTVGNIHYPSGWMYVNPKVDPTNVGNPVSAINNESDQISYFKIRAGIMTGGFSGGSVNTTTDAPSNGNQFSVSSVGSISLGEKLCIYDGEDFCAGTVVAINVKIITLSFIVPPAVGIKSGADVQGSFSGFSNSQRGSLPNTTEFKSIRFSMDKNSNILKQSVSNQLDALKANSSGGNESAAAACNSLVASITNWQNGSSNSRYTDAVLNPFLTTLNTRLPAAQSRANLIIKTLGSAVNSSSDGSVSGSGSYLDAFNWISQRIGMIDGSLRGYFDSDLAIAANNSTINSLQQKQASYNSSFLIQIFSKDSVGSATVFLASSFGYSVGSAVKVVADNQPVLTVKVLKNSIADNSLTFDTLIPVSYSKASNARVVYQK